MHLRVVPPLNTAFRSTFLEEYGSGAPPARLEYVLALARAFLANCGLLAIFLDPTEPARLATTTYVILTGYALYSLLVLAIVHRATELRSRDSRLFHAVDITWTGVLTFVSDGPVSPFYLFFLFVVLAAAYRWGMRETLATVFITFLLFLVQTGVAITGGYPELVESSELAWNRIIVRAAYLLITGALAGFFADQDKAQRAEIAAVADAMQQARVDLGLGGSVRALSAMLLRVFRAAAADIVIHEWSTNRAVVWHVVAGGSDEAPTASRVELQPGDEERWLFDDHAATWHAEAAQPGMTIRARAVQPGAWQLRQISVQLPGHVPPEPFRTLTVTNIGLAGEWRGRVFLYDATAGGTLARRLHFLALLTIHVAPALTNVVLMRRLRSQAGAAERARVARELHDGTIQSLFGIEMKLEALRRSAPVRRGLINPGRDDSQLADALTEIQDLLRAEILGMRELMQALRPVELDAVHQLPDVLASVVERFRRDCGISARFVSNADALHLTPAASIEVVRIVQEALANVRKHSRARNVLVRFTALGELYTLTIEDDGRGFDFSGVLSHDELDRARTGPAIIKERARLLGGHLTVESTPGEGARLEITFGAPVHV